MKKILYLLGLTLVMACSSEEEPISGCTDPDSPNYNPDATVENGSCTYLRDVYLGNYDGVFGGCMPDEESNNFDELKSVVIQPGENADEVKVIINEISVEDFREQKVMTFTASVTENELIFSRSESSDRFVLGEISIRLFLSGNMSKDATGNLSGRITIDVYDTGTADTSLGLYNCDFSFTRK